MNEKLMKWSSKQVRPAGAGHKRSKRGSDELIIINVSKRKNKSGEEIASCVRFSFHPSLIRKLGWIAKDMVAFEYDAGCVYFCRDNEGYTISKHTNTGSRFYARFAIQSEYAELFKGKTASEIEAKVGRLAFLLV